MFGEKIRNQLGDFFSPTATLKMQGMGSWIEGTPFAIRTKDRPECQIMVVRVDLTKSVRPMSEFHRQDPSFRTRNTIPIR